MAGDAPTVSTVGRDADDLLAGSEWACVWTAAGQVSSPAALEGRELLWLDARVPGTVADALRDVGASEPSIQRLDGNDWWYRCRFVGPTDGTTSPDGWLLNFDGLATIADVWLNGRHVAHSESMFDAVCVPVDRLEADNELWIRFGALTQVLEQRRPRPRWKTKGVTHQNLRWIRTSLLGRQAGWAAIPAPVGPWRPLSLRPVPLVDVVNRRVRATCADGPGGRTRGTVSVVLHVRPGRDVDLAEGAVMDVDGTRSALTATVTDDLIRLEGSVSLDAVERWWPHTHGDQPRYAVRAEVGGVLLDLGAVGFRTVTADRSDGGFRVIVNDVPVFCRGAGWYPLDPVSLQSSDAAIDAAVRRARDAGMNMLRIPGGTVYEQDHFFDACDRHGILVWQEAMLGPVDPPSDEGFLEVMSTEVTSLLDRTAHHPCLAVFCGGEEIEEQAAMFGLPRERWPSPVIHELLPRVVDTSAPGLAYVTSSPSGGDLPFQTDTGVSHYVGVGVYLFPLEDLRRAGPRFVSEGLAMSIPPERSTVDEEFGGDLSAHHESDWKRAVHRDAGSWFDLEDVRDHYTNAFFTVDMSILWRTDHERALDLGRAAMAEVITAALSEWRRTGSTCDGMLYIALQDLRPGPGWGLVDSVGRPKAPWYAFARASAPVAVLTTDEGVNGLAIHLVNDGPEVLHGTVRVGLHTAVHSVETESCAVVVPARGGTSVRADGLFDGFRDLTYAYCFGARSYELVTAELLDAEGRVLARAGYLPGGPARDIDPDVGLQATLEAADGEAWHLRVSSQRFAEYVQVDVPGYVADDSWFHLPPGGERTVLLRPEAGPGREPRGRIRALNSATDASVAP